MSLLVFKTENYKHTAEREQYRTICNILKEKFFETDDICIFAANWNIYGSELDGLLIKQDAIIAVEFKNYGGIIIAKENGDWTTEDGTVIKGGVRKNPYTQAKINRSNLLNGLRDSGFITSKALRHISSLIVFNQPIQLNDQEISPRVQTWLHICDNSHFINKIEDITSNLISFSNEDLIQLVKSLNFDLGGNALDTQYSNNLCTTTKQLAKVQPQPLTISKLATQNSELSVSETLPDILESELPAYVGIDFGTSTTVVSIARYYNNNMKCNTVAIPYKTFDGAVGRDERVATMLAYKDGTLLAGNGAEEFKYDLERDSDIWYSFKMALGEDLGDQYTKSSIKDIKSPKDAAKLFFKYLTLQIKKTVKASKYEFAVTIPASFEANQRRDLIEALEYNGINISKQALIDEPNAAFLSTIIDDQMNNKSIRLKHDSNLSVLVFDYGAGTCDISILEIGLDHHGAFSKNKAISRFEKCGGDDIDRCVAERILLPQLLSQINENEGNLRHKQKTYLLNHLMKPAELLKIEICNRVSNQMTDSILPPLAVSTEKVVLNNCFCFEYEGRTIEYEHPEMSFCQFNDIMKIFLNQEFSESDSYNSIFKSVNSAIEKSKVSKQDIDYVLLIGGSSYNPYVQYALFETFRNSTLRIPANLQSHVSQGAAIHSLIYYALNHNIIKPISSEPIFVITKGVNSRRILVPAGTYMPSDSILIDDLETSCEGQECIELPICVGDEKKILSNFVIQGPEGTGFHAGETVKIRIRLTADKLLKGVVEVRESSYEIEPLNPLSNNPLSSEDAVILKAQREVNNDASQHNGKASISSLKSLAEAYEKTNKYLETAELYEEINEQYPGTYSLNNIALKYGEAGNPKKKIELLEKACSESPNDATVLFNLAITIKGINGERYRQLMEKSISLCPNSPCHLFDFGCWLKNHNERRRGEDLITNALQIWNKKYINNAMGSWDYSWYAYALEYNGDYLKAQEVRRHETTKTNDIYNELNLTKQR